MSSQTVAKKWALVTGASSGIGAAFAKRIAKDKYNLVLVGRRLDRLNDLANSIKQQVNLETICLPLDLQKSEAVREIATVLDSKGISIALLFNNAGYGTNGEFCDLDIERELLMIDLNCRSLVALSYEIARRMRNSRSGIIVHTASVGGFSPTPFYATYGATKSFVIAFSEALGEELSSHGIRVYTLCPGATESEFETVSNFRGERPPRAAFQTCAAVVEETVKALDSKSSLVITGKHNRLMVSALRFLPRRWALRMAARSMKPAVS